MNTELPRETPLVTLRPEPWAENLKHNQNSARADSDGKTKIKIKVIRAIL